jgi:hypothetical protein
VGRSFGNRTRAYGVLTASVLATLVATAAVVADRRRALGTSAARDEAFVPKVVTRPAGGAS